MWTKRHIIFNSYCGHAWLVLSWFFCVDAATNSGKVLNSVCCTKPPFFHWDLNISYFSKYSWFSLNPRVSHRNSVARFLLLKKFPSRNLSRESPVNRVDMNKDHIPVRVACPDFGRLTRHETNAAQMRQKVWHRNSGSNVRGVRQLETWPNQWFHSRNMPSTTSTPVNSSLLQWPDEDRKNAINRGNTYLINISKWYLHLLHFYGTGGVDGAPRWGEITHIVRLTCWNPHPPLENHRTVSNRCHSQGFSTYSLFFLNSLPECFLSGRSMCFTWLPAEGTQGPWRARMKSSGSDVFQPGLRCCHWTQTERFPLKLGSRSITCNDLEFIKCGRTWLWTMMMTTWGGTGKIYSRIPSWHQVSMFSRSYFKHQRTLAGGLSWKSHAHPHGCLCHASVL